MIKLCRFAEMFLDLYSSKAARLNQKRFRRQVKVSNEKLHVAAVLPSYLK